MTPEISQDEIKAAQEAVQPYRTLITETPFLLSLLYDIDLLPEQIRLHVNATRMITVCELFRLIPPEVLTKAMEDRGK